MHIIRQTFMAIITKSSSRVRLHSFEQYCTYTESYNGTGNRFYKSVPAYKKKRKEKYAVGIKGCLHHRANIVASSEEKNQKKDKEQCVKDRRGQ